SKKVGAAGSGVATNDLRLVYDGWNLVAILNPDFSLLTSFTWGLDLSGTMEGAGGVGGLLWMTVPAGANAGTYFCAHDGNGNVMALVSAADGSVAARYEYGPFGELIRATGPMAKTNPFLFSTKYYDWETGLYYYGYRDYDPGTGRWLSRDPLGEEGGINLYEAFRNDPVSYVDADGQSLWSGSLSTEVEASSAGFPSAEASWFSRPIRPDDRDEPSRYRCGRRPPPECCANGDPNCNKCGPDVSSGLAPTLAAVKSRFYSPTTDKKNVCSLSHLFGTWGIVFPTPPKGCGEGRCSSTVMVNGKCYDKWNVNYLLFGYISKLCGFSRTKMEALVAGQKLIRKPVCDGDWRYQYTGDVRGYMRIGFAWNGKLPAELPGPTGGFSGCKACDKPGWNDPKYKGPFSTTWP
ncbi:MAG TPA: RHS repeat-associated core domain-containing protein, partial [Candidatus Paceibacterota bacterium]|nr:RHS repeat-associated core domain-containing protein [Candidatus Paceibacterota bacterium]